MPQPNPPRPVGRPATLPPGSRRRSIRMTDDEYVLVVAWLAKRRKQGRVKT